MKARSLVVYGALCVALFAAAAASAQAVDLSLLGEECRVWRTVFQDLKAKIDEYRTLKKKSIEPRVLEMMKTSDRGSTARVVRSILDDRKRRLTELREVIDGVIDSEKKAFRSCRSRIRGAARSERGALKEWMDERKAVLNDGADTLLDEAYAQYRRESPRRAASSSGRGHDPYSPQAAYWNQRRNERNNPTYDPYRYQRGGYGYPPSYYRGYR